MFLLFHTMLLSLLVQHVVLFADAFNKTNTDTSTLVNRTVSNINKYVKDEHGDEKRGTIIGRKDPIKLNSKQGLIMNQVLNVYGIEKVENALCVKHSLEFKSALRAFEPWALKMVDSSSKLQSGLISGNLMEFGSFKQCIHIEADTSSGIIRGKQCTLKIIPPLNILKKMLWYKDISEKRFEKIKPIVEDVGIYWSVCVPDSCASEDVLKHFTKHLKIISEGLNLTVTLDELFCSSLQDAPVLTTKQYIAMVLWPLFNAEVSFEYFIGRIDKRVADCYVSIFGSYLMTDDVLLSCYISSSYIAYIVCSGNSVLDCIIVQSVILGIIGVNLLCGLIDICTNEQSKIKKSILIDVFSSYRNAKSIFVYDADNSLGLRCLDGIRVLSTAYVVMGHSFLMLLFAPSVNSLDLMEWLLKYSSTVIIGGTVSVDSFFMLGGSLVTYHTLHYLSKRNGKFNWFLFLIYRFVRLTPPLAMAIFIETTLLQFFGSGPLWRKTVEGIQKPCEYFWWSALLNIQNYINPKCICITQTWFLTADFIYYAFSPILIYPLWKRKALGWINLFVFYIISVMVNFYLAWVNKYGAGMMITNRLLVTDYFAYHYIAPHVRASTYILGIALGGILYRTENLKIKLHPITVTVGWIWSSVLMLVTILGNHPFQLEEYEYDRLETSFYLALSRSSWTMGLIWIVWACRHGYGGPVNSFLKNPVFQILAKLTYSIFIWHLPFQFLLVGALKQPLYFSDFNMVYRFFGEFCIVIAFSLLYVILFESPCIRLGKYLNSRSKKVTDKI